VNVNTDLSLITLLLNASALVKLVIFILLVGSMLSWWYIFLKLFAIKRTQTMTDTFERNFWGGSDLNTLFQQATRGRHDPGSGFREFLKHRRQQGIDVSAVMDGTRRAMRATYQREMDHLESHLSFLASVGSVSPYVGLLGTVWGIMNSFRGLANVGQATLAHVAPGIAEALIATAIGLFAAIPAVVAYNRYFSEIDRLSIRFESFMEEFSNILQRQLHPVAS
jgi:biopolymer transport protein TolQ